MKHKLSLAVIFSSLFLCLIFINSTPRAGGKIIQSPSQELLERQGVFSWPTWESEPREFIWQFTEREIAYLLEGEVFVIPEGSKEVLHFQKGDIGYFDAGLRCKWVVTKPLKKHVILEKNMFQDLYWTAAFKLQGATRRVKSILFESDNVFMERASNT